MNRHAPPVTMNAPALLKNVAAMLTLVETLRNRPQISCGFGVFSGPSGFGKTVASTYAQNQYGCLYIEAREFWTRKAFCEALLEELGQKPRGTIPQMMKAIVQILGHDIGQALIIDEADKLVDKGMIELARDIQEMTNAPVILVGEETLPAKLQAFERVHNRVLDWVLAQPCDLQDARLLARRILPGIEIEDALLEKICRETGGRTRRIANSLFEAATVARTAGVARLTVETYQGRIFTGVAPVRAGSAAPTRLVKRLAGAAR